MKTFKYRDKHILLLKKELEKIHSRSTRLNVRGNVRKALKYLNEIVDFIERYDSVILAVKSVKVKNIYLARALQNERERSNRLLQEKIESQSGYHDVLREKAELKKDNWNLEQQIMSDLEDYKNIILPNIVELSENVTKKMMKLDHLKRSISLKRNTDSLPPRSIPNISFGTNSNQPVSAVNPMVKGCVIQKPIINVRRVPFPNETRSSMFEYMNINSPILEESEENVSPPNNLARRCENGLKNALNISNRRRVQRPELSVTSGETNFSESSPIGDNQVNGRIEPVVRLEDVTRLLQHSSIRISETPNASPIRRSAHLRETLNQHWSPEVLIPKISTPIRPSVVTTDDALEGSSWMYQIPSVNIHEERSQPESSQNNSSYQSRVQFTPDYIRNTPKDNRANTDQPAESTSSADEILSTRRKPKFFHSCKSPSIATRPLESDSHSQVEEVEVVSSTNNGDTVPLAMITQRKRKEVSRARFSCPSRETCGNDSCNSSVGLDGSRRSARQRRSARTSSSSESSETKPVVLATKKSTRSKKQRDSVEVENVTLEDSEITDFRRTKRIRKPSKRTLSDSNVSSSELDDTSRQSRNTRNRSNVSYKEPSLHAKMRRA